MLKSSASPHAPEPPLPELALVKARRVLRQGDESIPKGAVGTIVHVYDAGDAVEVEFADPSSAVLLVQRVDLETV